MIITWLSYLTKANYDKRIDNYMLAFDSLKLLKDCGARVILVDNSEHDNFMLPKLRDSSNLQFEIFKTQNEFGDIAGHFIGYLLSKLDDSYFAYLYDDFVIYDGKFVEPSKVFLSQNSEVTCIRLPKYEFKDSKTYNTTFTHKDVNPDSVGHFSAPFNGAVVHEGPFEINGYDFYKSNWRSISRPTLWNARFFEKFVGFPNSCPTFQEFERFMNENIDEMVRQNHSWKSGFIDHGVCHTFPQNTSERISSGIGYNRASPVVDLIKLQDMLACSERWL